MNAADRALAIVLERGPIDNGALATTLAAEGIDVDFEGDDELAFELTERGLWHLDGSLWATPEQIAEGRTATRRVTAAELAAQQLVLDIDLTLTGFLLDVDEPMPLAGGDGTAGSPGQVHRSWFERGQSPLAVDHMVEILDGPEGWLDALTVGDLVAVTVRGGVLATARVEEADDGEVPAFLAATFAEQQMESGVALVPYLVAVVAIRHPEAFAVARRPLSELFAAAGLSVELDEVAAADFDWAAHGEARLAERVAQLAYDFGIGEDDARLLLRLEFGYLNHGERTIDEDEWAGIADAFTSATVTSAFVGDPFGPLGLFADGASAERLGAFAQVVLDRNPQRPPAGASIVSGRCRLEAGDGAGFDAAVTAALRADPGFEPALFDAGLLASIRGQASRAIGYFDQAGYGDEPHVALLDAFAAPGRTSAERNDRCPCGSGAKHKSCCGPFNGHPLRDRSLWLYEKAAMWAHLAPGRRDRVPLACAAAGVESIDAEPDLVAVALNEENLTDLHLFDAGWLARFAGAAGELLPPDERTLLEGWLDRRHRLWELVDRPADGTDWQVRDVISGAEVAVVDLPGAPGWAPGDRLFGVVVPLDLAGAEGFMGAVRKLTTTQADAVAGVLARGSDGAASGSDGAGGTGTATELAVEVVGPALAAAAAAREALLDSGWDERVEWLFPGEELDPDELDDDELLAEMVAEHYLPPFVEVDDHDEQQLLVATTMVTMAVARQLLALDPPEVWDAAGRMTVAGAGAEDVVASLAKTLLDATDGSGKGDPGQPVLDRYLTALRALPGES